jgi:hypothetical protein
VEVAAEVVVEVALAAVADLAVLAAGVQVVAGQAAVGSERGSNDS